MNKELRNRLGRCYELAGRYVLYAPDAVLVHGSIQGFGFPRIGHAWVELPSGSIYDGVTDQEFDADDHAAIFNPLPEQWYQHEEVCVLMLQAGHWGPWEEPLYPVNTITHPSTRKENVDG